MQKHLRSCRINHYTTLRGTSKRKNKISTTYKAAFLTPTQENRNAAFFMPSCYAVRANKALIYAALRAWKWERQGLIPFPSKPRFYCVTNPTKRSDEAMAVFRVEKNKGYTVMSNHHASGFKLPYFLLISYCMQSFSRQRTKSVVPSAARSLYQNRTASNTARTAGSGLPADRQPSAWGNGVRRLRDKGKKSLDLQGINDVKLA